MSNTQRLLRLTASNYIALLIKIVIMIVLTRQLFLQLSHESYGFWVLLWSVFGYSVLLDFGFGTALQKASSEVLVSKRWAEFNAQASTIVGNYILLSIVLGLFTVVAAPFLSELFQFNNNRLSDSLQRTFIIFGLGTALLFPLGIFSEVLRGAQLMPLRNTIEVLREMFNCIAIVSVLYADLGLEYVALVAVLIQFIANVSLCVFAHKKLPHMKLSYRLYQPKQQMGIFKFSFIAYIVMLSNLMIYRSDQLVISVVGGVAMVALYHVAVRMAELFRQLCSQLHDVLAPMSASLHRGGDQKGLRILYQTSLHYVTILVAIAIVPAIVYIDVFINLWLELDNVETVWCAQILLINAAVLVVFRNTSNQVLLMCGYHKACMWMGVAEAIANIVLSVILLNIYGIVGVALGTLIPNVFIAIVFNVPLASKFLGISSLHLFRELVSKMALILCGSIGSYLLIEQCLWNYSELSKALLGAPVIVLVALLMAYRWVLSDHERASLRQWFARTSTCYV